MNLNSGRRSHEHRGPLVVEVRPRDQDAGALPGIGRKVVVT